MPETIHAEARYRAITAQAWSGMLMVQLAISITDVFELLGDKGSGGNLTALWVDAYIVCLNSLVQVGVRTFDAPRFRKVVAWTSIVYTLFFVLDHVILAGVIVGPNKILYFTHHIIGVWAVFASVAWSNLARVEAAGDIESTVPVGPQGD
jgi:hypothetical protein